MRMHEAHETDETGVPILQPRRDTTAKNFFSFLVSHEKDSPPRRESKQTTTRRSGGGTNNNRSVFFSLSTTTTTTTTLIPKLHTHTNQPTRKILFGITEVWEVGRND